LNILAMSGFSKQWIIPAVPQASMGVYNIPIKPQSATDVTDEAGPLALQWQEPLEQLDAQSGPYQPVYSVGTVAHEVDQLDGLLELLNNSLSIDQQQRLSLPAVQGAHSLLLVKKTMARSLPLISTKSVIRRRSLG
jgi:hypothetical protein